MLRTASLFLVFAVTVGLLSCTKSTIDPALLAKHKERFTLSDEPEDVHADAESTELEHAGEEHDHEGETAEEHAAHKHEHDHVFPTEAKEVAMVGQVGGLANPWEETQPEFPFSTHYAVFFLADPQAVAEHAEEGHVHAPGEECAFCAAHAASR
jgi:hypothetical protein